MLEHQCRFFNTLYNMNTSYSNLFWNSNTNNDDLWWLTGYNITDDPNTLEEILHENL